MQVIMDITAETIALIRKLNVTGDVSVREIVLAECQRAVHLQGLAPVIAGMFAVAAAAWRFRDNERLVVAVYEAELFSDLQTLGGRLGGKWHD